MTYLHQRSSMAESFSQYSPGAIFSQQLHLHPSVTHGRLSYVSEELMAITACRQRVFCMTQRALPSCTNSTKRGRLKSAFGSTYERPHLPFWFSPMQKRES